MKTPIHILWLCFIAVTVTSCAKDDNDCDPNDRESLCYAGPAGGGKLLLMEAKINGATRGVYEYDNQNRVTVIYAYSPEGALELTTTYTYNGNAVFPSGAKAKNKEGQIAVEEYTFGSDGKPVSMVASVPADPDNIPLDYQFSYFSNQLIETIIAREDNPSVYVNTYTYDGNGNLLSIEYTVDGQLGATTTQDSYDDKIAVGLHGNPLAWKFPGINNFQTLTTTSTLLGVITDQVWEYTYNDAGYPIKAEVSDAASGASVETHEYRYVPAK